MSGLPKGWISQPLKSLIILNEKFKDIEDDTECGFVPMNRVPTNLLDQVSFETKPWGACKKGYTHFKNGDVLLAKITPCFENGKSALVSGLPNGIGAGSTEYFVLRSVFINPEFLHAFLKTKDFKDDCTVRMSGSVGHKRVPKDYLLEYPFPLPPLNEQTRIANKLDSLLAKVDAAQTRLERIPTLLKRFRQSVLAAATSGELTIGKGWKRVSIDSLCDSSFYGPRFSKNDYSQDGVPTIRTTDMTSYGEIEISDSTPRIVVPEEKVEQFRVKKGDLLITRTGSIGTMAVFDGDYIAFPSAYLIRFRFPNSLNVKFLYYFLTSPKGQELMGLGVTTVAQPNINAKTIRAIELDLPSRQEQNEIVRRVESLFAMADTVEKQYQQAKQRVDRLTQSILAKAFKGELVPQDPNDEPASELLKRIQAEREQQKTQPKKAGARKSKTSPKKKKTVMKLNEAPETYLFDLLAKLGGEAQAEILWKQSDLAIDDFYAKLKQEMAAKTIVDDNPSSDPGLRKLKIA